MPNTLMSATFCRHNDFDVYTQGYGFFLFFIACLSCFLWFFGQNLELGLCPFSHSKIHENVIECTFITFSGSTRLYERGTPWSPL
jgi:hypothetical protein